MAGADGGECWSLSEYILWLKDAGFASVENHAAISGTKPGTTLIIAEKK